MKVLTMHMGCISKGYKLKSLFLASLLVCVSTALADPIDDAEDLPATAEEVQFIDAIITGVKEAAPVVEGWHRDISATASGNTVKEGETPLIYSRARDFPLKIIVQVNYREVTDTDRKQAAEKKSSQQLQEEMMAAAMRGDTAKMEELQLELATMMQASMEAGAMGQAAGITPIQPRENPKKFHVQIVVNGDGESIGKEYDFDVPNVTKAFRVDKGSDDFLSYKYYLGRWDISELDQKNWRVADPADAQTAENHLRALVAYVNVYGDRSSVEEFVDKQLDLSSLNQLVD